MRSNFLRQADYTYLEREGALQLAGEFNRGDQDLAAGGLWQAYTTLTNRNADTSASARAVLTLIQMFCEGARFDFMSSNINEAIRDGQKFTAATPVPISGDGSTSAGPNHQVTGIDFENNWARLSNYVRDRLNDGRAILFRIGSVEFTTMQAIAAQLAIAYMGYRHRSP